MSQFQLLAFGLEYPPAPVILWWLVLAVLGIFGQLTNFWEMYRFLRKQDRISLKYANIVSLSHAMLIGTGLSYEIFSRIGSVDGSRYIPFMGALALMVAIYFILTRVGHSPKSHIVSFMVTGFGALGIYILHTDNQLPTFILWVLGLSIFALSAILVQRIRSSS